MVRRTHAAYSVSIGKTQVPEFALHCYSENQVGSPARNPLAPARTAGGSSGGAAAAVAAGILPSRPEATEAAPSGYRPQPAGSSA